MGLSVCKIFRDAKCNGTHLSDELGLLKDRELAQSERPEIRIVKAVHRRLRQEARKQKTRNTASEFVHLLYTTAVSGRRYCCQASHRQGRHKTLTGSPRANCGSKQARLALVEMPARIFFIYKGIFYH